MCRWLYWSELNGSRSRVMRSTLNGTSISMLTSQIQTPNGLHLDVFEEILFILDGVNGSLFSCSLSTSYEGAYPLYRRTVDDELTYYTYTYCACFN
jgi:sugar lactone lactonase YvrE